MAEIKTIKINNKNISDLADEMAKERLRYSGKGRSRENSCHMACFLQGRQFKGIGETFTWC